LFCGFAFQHELIVYEEIEPVTSDLDSSIHDSDRVFAYDVVTSVLELDL